MTIKVTLHWLDGEDSIIEVDTQITVADLKEVIEQFAGCSLSRKRRRTSETRHGCKRPVLLKVVLGNAFLVRSRKVLVEVGVREGTELTVIKEQPELALTDFNTCSAKVWNTSTGECIQTLSGHTSIITDAAFGADADFLVTASADCTARIWDTISGECLQLFRGHSEGLHSVALSRDGCLVLTASCDKSARLWDRFSGECTQIFGGHTESVRSGMFSVSADLVLTVGDDHMAKVWSTASGDCKRTFLLVDLTGALFSRNGVSILTYAGREAVIWSVCTGDRMLTLSGHRGNILYVAFSVDGVLAITASMDGFAKVWNATSGECAQELTCHGHVRCARFSADSCTAVTINDDFKTRIWNVCSGECMQTFVGVTSFCNNWRASAVISENGEFVLATSTDAAAKIWNVSSGVMMHLLECCKVRLAILSTQ